MTFAVLLPVFPSHPQGHCYSGQTQEQSRVRLLVCKASGFSDSKYSLALHLTFKCQTTCMARAQIIGLGF